MCGQAMAGQAPCRSVVRSSLNSADLTAATAARAKQGSSALAVAVPVALVVLVALVIIVVIIVRRRHERRTKLTPIGDFVARHSSWSQRAVTTDMTANPLYAVDGRAQAPSSLSLNYDTLSRHDTLTLTSYAVPAEDGTVYNAYDI